MLYILTFTLLYTQLLHHKADVHLSTSDAGFTMQHW